MCGTSLSGCCVSHRTCRAERVEDGLPSRERTADRALIGDAARYLWISFVNVVLPTSPYTGSMKRIDVGRKTHHIPGDHAWPP